MRTIPQRIVWKWEGQPLKNLPPNVLMIDWLPQQDLLGRVSKNKLLSNLPFYHLTWIWNYKHFIPVGHHNCKVLITHAGLLSTQEAIYHAVPILGLPFGNDQRANIVKAEVEGYGLVLAWDKIDTQSLEKALKRLTNDPRWCDVIHTFYSHAIIILIIVIEQF